MIFNNDRVVICPYCCFTAKLVSGDEIYPHRKDLYEKKFWLCKTCNAYVGTHSNSKDHAPLGNLANKELRQIRLKAHSLFDPIWKNKHESRKNAYTWLAREMRMDRNKCHIAMMSVDQCKKVIEICKQRMEL